MKRQGAYLNIVLTAVTILLAALLWTQFSGQGGMVRSSFAADRNGSGVPDAGEQRERMIREIQELRNTLEATRKLMESGRAKVQVTNLDQIDAKRDR